MAFFYPKLRTLLYTIGLFMENKKDKEEYKKIIYVTKEQLEKGIVFGPEDTNIKIVIVDYDKNISK